MVAFVLPGRLCWLQYRHLVYSCEQLGWPSSQFLVISDGHFWLPSCQIELYFFWCDGHQRSVEVAKNVPSVGFNSQLGLAVIHP
jgi:hypothetical protein